ncbi:MAG: ATP-dependent protease ATPase subunit HslU [Planctomycetaceae bacterium]|nr:ATP-dependent protease ATPase subunit HslU [Planctomycetaceae bacterium]
MFPIPPTFSERKEEDTEVSENTESLKNEKLMTGDNSDEKENEKNDGVFTDKEILSSNDNSSENQTVASEKENAESNSLSDEISNQENTDQEITDQDKGSGTPVPGKKDDLSNESLREAGMRAGEQAQKRSEEIRESLRAQLRAGELEEREIKIPTRKKSSSPVMMMNIAGPDMENGLSDLLGKMLPKKTVRRTLPIREARKVMLEMEYDQLLDEEKIQTSAVELAENTGIIFLDEIDKIVASNSKHGADVSRQGVQRDLLPIVEGTTIQTRYGYVKTDHILFIAAGAFHQNRPGDLMPELQGRFPIRVELHDLTKEDFSRILREPQNALIHQYQALLETEGLKISFQPEAIETLADCAWKVNQMTQNIGARRLCTILERLLEEISFEAPERTGETIEIDAAYVQERLKDVTQDEDLSRFIL